MSEPNPSEDLSPFEARLAELLPRPAEIGRDEILFEAGRQEAFRQQRRVVRRWYAISAVLATVICGQWIVLTGQGATSIADAPTATEEAAVPSNIQLVEGTPSPASSEVPPQANSDSVAQGDRSTHVSSIWEKLIPLPATDDSTIALGHDLTVGSLVSGMPYDSFSVPKAGRMSVEDEPVLSPMHRRRLSEQVATTTKKHDSEGNTSIAGPSSEKDIDA